MQWCVFGIELEGRALLRHGNLALRDQLADGSDKDGQVSAIASHLPQQLQRVLSSQLQERWAAVVASDGLPSRLAGHATEQLAEGRVRSQRLAALATAAGRVRVPHLLELFQICGWQIALLAGHGWLIGARVLSIKGKARPFLRRTAMEPLAKELHEFGAERGQIGISAELLFEPL